MNGISRIPELVALEGSGNLIRIPNQIDVPITPRVQRLIDTPDFQRLKRVSQLGLVAFVYPGAHHHRFEHSLGVYRMGLLFLRQLAHDERFAALVSEPDATVFILAALLHDLGHWPFCHPIEDLKLSRIPSHEAWAERHLNQNPIRALLRQDWGVEPEELSDMINKRAVSPAGKILSSILSGPIDIDKMDYLYRDSLHCGVPYGQNFDAPRLIRSLCIDSAGERLAITHKGKTAAELLVFARYVMFSEVYWHHAVRSATAMFQRGFYRWYQSLESVSDSEFEIRLEQFLQLNELDMVQHLKCNQRGSGSILIDRLFGQERQLFKRVAAFSCLDGESTYRRIAQRPYPWLVESSHRLAAEMTQWLGQPVEPDQILIDAPPVGLEVQFNVQVHYPKESRYVALETVSPVVQTLAKRQFDDFVKQVRVFVEPVLSTRLKSVAGLREKIAQFLEQEG